MKWWHWLLLGLAALFLHGAWHNARIQTLRKVGIGEALLDQARRWWRLPGEIIDGLNREAS